MSDIENDFSYVEIVTFEVDGVETQKKLLEGILEQSREWVCQRPGFISATFYKSHDGKYVLNYAQWRSQADWEAYSRDGRRDRIHEAITAAAARLVSARNYSVAEVVIPKTG